MDPTQSPNREVNPTLLFNAQLVSHIVSQCVHQTIETTVSSYKLRIDYVNGSNTPDCLMVWLNSPCQISNLNKCHPHCNNCNVVNVYTGNLWLRSPRTEIIKRWKTAPEVFIPIGKTFHWYSPIGVVNAVYFWNQYPNLSLIIFCQV